MQVSFPSGKNHEGGFSRFFFIGPLHKQHSVFSGYTLNLPLFPRGIHEKLPQVMLGFHWF
jgi:hypothetical protein